MGSGARELAAPLARRANSAVMGPIRAQKGHAIILDTRDRTGVDAAEWRRCRERHAYREIARHSRETHDLLRALLREFPQHTPDHLRVYRRTIENAIRMLEQLRSELPTLH